MPKPNMWTFAQDACLGGLLRLHRNRYGRVLGHGSVAARRDRPHPGVRISAARNRVGGRSLLAVPHGTTSLAYL